MLRNDVSAMGLPAISFRRIIQTALIGPTLFFFCSAGKSDTQLFLGANQVLLVQKKNINISVMLCSEGIWMCVWLALIAFDMFNGLASFLARPSSRLALWELACLDMNSSCFCVNIFCSYDPACIRVEK